MTTADALPVDMPGLRAAALALIAERDELLRRVERMRQLIRQFQRAQFGRHSERLDPDQLAQLRRFDLPFDDFHRASD
jgi:transposase IS166 family protein